MSNSGDVQWADLGVPCSEYGLAAPKLEDLIVGLFSVFPDAYYKMGLYIGRVRTWTSFMRSSVRDIRH